MEQNYHRLAHQEVSAEIALLQEKIRELTVQMADLQTVERWHAQKAGAPVRKKVGPEPFPAEPVNNSTPPPISSGTDRNGAPDRFARHTTMKEAAVAVLRDAKKYMTTPNLAAAILQGGYPTSNPAGFRNSIFAMLNKEADTFFRCLPGIWGLLEDKEFLMAKQDEAIDNMDKEEEPLS